MPVPRAYCGANAAHLLASLPGPVWLLTLLPTCLLGWSDHQEQSSGKRARRPRILWERPALPLFEPPPPSQYNSSSPKCERGNIL